MNDGELRARRSLKKKNIIECEKMRICPKCGFSEHPMWRPRRSRVFCDYVKLETLEYNAPELAMDIKEAEPDIFFDGHFVYHISRTRLNVEKIEKSLFDIMKWGQEPQEKTHGGNQLKLFS